MIAVMANVKLIHWADYFRSDVDHFIVIRYHEADMRTGHATYWQLTSLQAFWPGLQVSKRKPLLVRG